MNTKPKFILVLLFLSFSIIGAFAQTLHQSINGGGGDATGTGGTVSYSAGQAFYTNASGSSGSIAPGVQQPFEISVITAIEQTEDISLVIEAFPNPTNSILLLKISGNRTEPMSYQLFDLFGKLLQCERIAGTATPIDMSNLAKASYLLRVISDKKEIKIFKIIKN
ncbi:MAG: T9SS type A sorting domain-containing protein [Lentimicrobium sp.]|nr:T9SS type A sorting domain-containing protein [Lentimicrobium sp.]